MLVFIGIRLGTERGVPNPRWIFFPFSWPHASAGFREIPAFRVVGTQVV